MLTYFAFIVGVASSGNKTETFRVRLGGEQLFFIFESDIIFHVCQICTKNMLKKINSVHFQLNQNIIEDIKGSVKDILKAQEEEQTRKKEHK